MDANSRIRQLMQDRGLSVYMLSKKSGISNTTLQNMFARNTMPSIATLEAVCKGLGITMAQFFQEGDSMVIDEQQRQLLEEFSKLPPHQREAIIHLIHAMNIQT